MEATNEDTETLLARAREGDAAAADRALDRQREKLRNMILCRLDYRLARRVDPSDVVQETMLAATARLPDYLNNTSIDFYPWLRDIASKKLVDLYRRHVVASRRSVDREFEFVWTDESAHHLAKSLAVGESEPWRRVSRQEIRRRVRYAMGQLKAATQEVLILRFVEQLSTREAAQVLGISESALKGRQVRALEMLRSILDEEDLSV